MSDSPIAAQFTGLVLLSGVDKPGITQALFNTLAPFKISILDIEQVVIKDRLILTVLISLNPDHQEAIEEDLQKIASEIGVDIATLYSVTESGFIVSKQGLIHVVVLGKKITPQAIALISSAIASQNSNIERIFRTASAPVLAIEFVVSGSSQAELSQLLTPIAAVHSIDIAVLPGGSMRYARKLVQLDVDSTLIAQEVIELLAAKAGAGEEVKKITDAAMRGELDFAESLRARTALLRGLPESVISEVQKEISLTPGARNLVATLNKLGHSVSVVSGGFIDVIEPLLKDLEIKHYKANKLKIEDGLLTGEIEGEIIDRAAKATALRDFANELGINMSHTIAIGDGANDLDMIAAAGFGIAFNAKPAVKAAADSAISDPYLDSVLYLLGITSQDSEE
jgi:phosphoserine phosphatase